MSVYRPTYRDPKTGETKESAQWWYEFTYAGKRYREPARTTRKTIAVAAEKQRRLQLERAVAGLPSESRTQRVASVKDRVAQYSADYASSHREKSQVFSRQRLEHVQRLLGSCLLCELSESKIQEYMRIRLSEGVGGRTINMEVGELSRAIKVKWSAAWPTVRKLEENHEVGRALSPEEEDRLLRTAAEDESPNRNPLLYTFLQVSLATGMRVGEIIGARWEQIDFDAEVVTVGKAKTKRGTGRLIPMNHELKAVLESHAAWYSDPTRFGEIRPEWYVFPGRDGRPEAGKTRALDPTLPCRSLNSSWDRIRQLAGVDCRLHDLRHTVATKMAEAGVAESTMLSLLGHMSRAMLERYSHIRMTAKREAVKSLTRTDSNGVPKVSPKVAIARVIQ